MGRLRLIHKEVTSKELLYSTGNTTQHLVMMYAGIEAKEEWICACEN